MENNSIKKLESVIYLLKIQCFVMYKIYNKNI